MNKPGITTTIENRIVVLLATTGDPSIHITPVVTKTTIEWSVTAPGFPTITSQSINTALHGFYSMVKKTLRDIANEHDQRAREIKMRLEDDKFFSGD